MTNEKKVELFKACYRGSRALKEMGEWLKRSPEITWGQKDEEILEGFRKQVADFEQLAQQNGVDLQSETDT